MSRYGYDFNRQGKLRVSYLMRARPLSIALVMLQHGADPLLIDDVLGKTFVHILPYLIDFRESLIFQGREASEGQPFRVLDEIIPLVLKHGYTLEQARQDIQYLNEPFTRETNDDKIVFMHKRKQEVKEKLEAFRRKRDEKLKP